MQVSEKFRLSILIAIEISYVKDNLCLSDTSQETEKAGNKAQQLEKPIVETHEI